MTAMYWMGTHARIIADALGGSALRIEHVGSISVPGLAAKPIIDILVVVPDSDAPTRQELATLKGHDDHVLSVAFSPDGETLASGSSDNTVKLCGTRGLDGSWPHSLKGHDDAVSESAKTVKPL